MRLDAQGTGSTATLTPGVPGTPAVATFGTGANTTSIAFANIGTIQEFATNHPPAFLIPSPLPPIPAQTGLLLINIPVATFQDTDLIENVASYQATINWGDGSAPTVGTIAADPSTPDRYVISGSHTYLAAGNDTIAVTLTDMGGTFNSSLSNAGGAVVPVSTQLDAIAAVSGNTATASITTPTPTPSPTPPDPPTPAFSWGRLSTQSDSGVSDSDGITNITTPTFVGGATAGSVMQVFATPIGSSASPVLIATGVANDSGAWAATVAGGPMPDGSYQITATASNSAGTASTSLGTVVIDTIAPVITNVVFRRLRGQMDVFFQDNLSGVFRPDLSNGANYQLSANPLNDQIPVRNNIIPTKVRVTPASTPNGIDEAAVIFNRGKVLNPGHYNIQVIAAGITDLAGNALSGRFYGSYPSGTGVSGGNFQAQITAFPNRVLGAFPMKTGYAKPTTSGKSNVAAAREQRRIKTPVVNVAKPGTGAADGSSQGRGQLLDLAIASLAGEKLSRRGR
jgi:hypothetical protein